MPTEKLIWSGQCRLVTSRDHKMSMYARALLTCPRLESASSPWLATKHYTSQRTDSHLAAVFRASAATQVSSEQHYRLDLPVASAGSCSSDTTGPQRFVYEHASSKQEVTISWGPDASMPHGLSGVPHKTAGIMDAYLLGATAVAATGQLQLAGYDWAQAALLVMVWQQALAAEQKSAADKALRTRRSKPLAASRKGICNAEAGLDKAKRSLRNKAEVFGWHLLSALNNNGYKPGLAYEDLPLEFQEFAYHLLLKCGCISSWALPVYRQLPAIAASIRPCAIVRVPLQQYLGIVQHTPTICRQDMDGTWWGDAEIRIHPFQVVSEGELAKALGPDMTQLLFKSGGGFAADLAAAAAKVGVLDGAAAAAACSTSGSSCLAELLLLKLSRACVGVSAAALASMWTMQQQETSSSPALAALAVSYLDCSDCCMVCACGGSGGSRRGSITAVGSDDSDSSDENVRAALAPVCKTSSWKNVGNAAVAARPSNNRTRLGLLSKAKSLVRRFFRR